MSSKARVVSTKKDKNVKEAPTTKGRKNIFKTAFSGLLKRKSRITPPEVMAKQSKGKIVRPKKQPKKMEKKEPPKNPPPKPHVPKDGPNATRKRGMERKVEPKPQKKKKKKKLRRRRRVNVKSAVDQLRKLQGVLNFNRSFKFRVFGPKTFLFGPVKAVGKALDVRKFPLRDLQRFFGWMGENNGPDNENELLAIISEKGKSDFVDMAFAVSRDFKYLEALSTHFKGYNNWVKGKKPKAIKKIVNRFVDNSVEIRDNLANIDEESVSETVQKNMISLINTTLSFAKHGGMESLLLQKLLNNDFTESAPLLAGTIKTMKETPETNEKLIKINESVNNLITTTGLDKLSENVINAVEVNDEVSSDIKEMTKEELEQFDKDLKTFISSRESLDPETIGRINKAIQVVKSGSLDINKNVRSMIMANADSLGIGKEEAVLIEKKVVENEKNEIEQDIQIVQKLVEEQERLQKEKEKEEIKISETEEQTESI